MVSTICYGRDMQRTTCGVSGWDGSDYVWLDNWQGLGGLEMRGLGLLAILAAFVIGIVMDYGFGVEHLGFYLLVGVVGGLFCHVIEKWGER